MRFMVLVKANKESEAGVLPDQKILAAMGKYNDELVKAGVMLAGEGLHSSSKGARVKFDGGTEIEIRQVFEPEDFGAALTPELREQEERQRRQMAAKK